MLDFLKIGNETSRVQKALAELKSKSQTLRQAREDAKELPIPREDMILAFHERIDEMARNGREELRRHYIPHTTCFQDSVNTIFGAFNGATFAGKLNENIICLLLGDLVKENIRREVAAWPWPDKTGPARAKRAAELARLDEEISEAEEDYADMRSRAEAAGIAVEKISAPIGKKGIR